MKRENPPSGLDDYAAFVAIVEQGSLTAAARQLGRSLQAVSRSLITLERDLGVVLVQRTTRRSAPTEAGLALLARARPALAELALARDEVRERAGRIAGRISVVGPALFGPMHLLPLLAAFMRRYPEIDIDLRLGERYADLVMEKLDLAVRFGELDDSSLRVRTLGAVRQGLFATPDYLVAHGTPRTPAALTTHRCVLRTSARTVARWRFTRERRVETVTVTGRFRSDSPVACNAAIAAGLGIGMAPVWQLRELLLREAVVEVLPAYQLPPMPIHLVWPASRLPGRVRRLIDHLAEGIDVAALSA